MDFLSNWTKTKGNTEQVFSLFENLDNLKKFMPEQVINWQASQNECSFTIKGMGDITLEVTERVPFKRITLVPKGKSPFEFNLMIHIRDNGLIAETQVQLSADLNMMMAMIAKRPLQNLVEIMADKIAQETF